MPDENNPPWAFPHFREKLRAVPLLGALVPMVAGIVCGTLVTVPLYVWITGTVVCCVTAWIALSRRSAFSTLYVAFAILFFGAALACVHAPRPKIPQGERIWMEMVIAENPIYREGRRSASTSGTVIGWQPDTPTAADTPPVPSGAWQTVREKLLVSLDTMWRFSAGERITFRGYVNPISGDTNSYLRFVPSHPGHSSEFDGSRFNAGYSRLMRARGFTGRTYVSQYSHPTGVTVKTPSPTLWAKNLQSAATERLRRLRRLSGNERTGMGESEAAIAAAMTTGDRSGITPELRNAYSRTGASHLLAVSGLHVGIVFVMINVLLYLLPLFPRGHILKNICATVAIWFYAALTGGSPSATRAAFMFTGAQLAMAASRTRNGANIMCGTALVMLAVRPGMLFDISFQLSFLAVAAILAWFTPLYRLLESRFKLLNALWATLIIGFVASAATMPLVSHTFGVFSPAGIVLNPLVIVTAHLVVGFSLIWIAAPVPVLEPIFRWLVGAPAWLQNRVVESVADVPGAAVEWTMPLWMVFAIYAAMIVFTLLHAMRSRREEIEPFILPR